AGVVAANAGGLSGRHRERQTAVSSASASDPASGSNQLVSVHQARLLELVYAAGGGGGGGGGSGGTAAVWRPRSGVVAPASGRHRGARSRERRAPALQQAGAHGHEPHGEGGPRLLGPGAAGTRSAPAGAGADR
ncbi:unnamed protein product, partial [Ectocarpus fasciculatus]